MVEQVEWCSDAQAENGFAVSCSRIGTLLCLNHIKLFIIFKTKPPCFPIFSGVGIFGTFALQRTTYNLHNPHLVPWQEPKYQSFWNFYSLFKRQDFGVLEILGLHPVREVGQIFQNRVAHLELVGSSIPMLRDFWGLPEGRVGSGNSGMNMILFQKFWGW